MPRLRTEKERRGFGGLTIVTTHCGHKKCSPTHSTDALASARSCANTHARSLVLAESEGGGRKLEKRHQRAASSSQQLAGYPAVIFAKPFQVEAARTCISDIFVVELLAPVTRSQKER
eukprot:6184996-Pleurochrysis_carterae.AAC.3